MMKWIENHIMIAAALFFSAESLSLVSVILFRRSELIK